MAKALLQHRSIPVASPQMHTLLAFLPLAQATPNGNPVNAIVEQLRQQSQVDFRTWVIGFAIGQLIAIVAILIASKTVVAEQYRDTFKNALRVWIKWWLVLIVVWIVIAAVLFGLSATNALSLTGWVLLAFFIVTLVVDIRIVMGTYKIGPSRSLGLITLTFVIWLVGQIAVNFVFGPSPAKQWALFQQIQQLTPAQRTELTSALRGDVLPGEAQARDRSKPLAERAAALETMYAELEKRRQALRPGDVTAKNTYEKQRARYEALLDQMRAEAHAKQGTAKAQ